MARAQRPAGHNTRGKTAPNRLRRLDAWVALQERRLLARRDGPWAHAVFVDLGFGAEPRTTLESAQRFRQIQPALTVIGIEIDRARVARAQEMPAENCHFRHGGFRLALAEDGSEPVRLLRAMNVLRQYESGQVHDAWAAMARPILPGGLMLEGTCDPYGRVMVVHRLRRTPEGLAHEGLLFQAALRADFEPGLFRARLPKSHIHRVLPGEPIHGFFGAWMEAWQSAARSQPASPRAHFQAAAATLGQQLPGVEAPPGWTRRGWLGWRLPEIALPSLPVHG